MAVPRWRVSSRWRRLLNHERENVVSCFSSHSLVAARTRWTVWMHCVRERGGLCSLCWLYIRTGDAEIGAPAFGGLGFSKLRASGVHLENHDRILQARSYK